MEGIDLTRDQILKDKDSFNEEIFEGGFRLNGLGAIKNAFKRIRNGLEFNSLFSSDNIINELDRESTSFINILLRDRGYFDPWEEVLHGKIGHCYRCGVPIYPWDLGYSLGDLCSQCHILVSDDSQRLLDIENTTYRNLDLMELNEDFLDD